MRKPKCNICGEKDTEVLPLNGEILGKSLKNLISRLINSEVNVRGNANTKIVCQQCAIQLVQADLVAAKCRAAFGSTVNGDLESKTAAPSTAASLAAAKKPKLTRRKTVDEKLLTTVYHHETTQKAEPNGKEIAKNDVVTPTVTPAQEDNVGSYDEISASSNDEDMIDISEIIGRAMPKKKYKTNKRRWGDETPPPSAHYTIHADDAAVNVSYGHEENKTLNLTEMDEAYEESGLSELEEIAAKSPRKSRPKNHFECDHCDYETRVIKNMKTHLLVKHDVKIPKIFKCSDCDKRYTTKTALNTHLKTKHNIDASHADDSKRDADETHGSHETTNIAASDDENNVESKKQLAQKSPKKTPKKPQKRSTSETAPLEISTLPLPSSELAKQNLITTFFVKTPTSSTPLHPQGPKEINAIEPKSTSKGKFFFTCEFCEQEFNGVNSYKDHLTNAHDVKEPRVFKCHICDKSFFRNQVLKRHLLNLHNEHVIASSSEINSENSSVIIALKPAAAGDDNSEQTQNADGGHTFVCENCDFTEKTAKYFKKHMIDVHGISSPQIYACDQCTNRYAHCKNLKLHKQRQHQRKNESVEQTTLLEPENTKKTITAKKPMEKKEKVLDIANVKKQLFDESNSGAVEQPSEPPMYSGNEFAIQNGTTPDIKLGSPKKRKISFESLPDAHIVTQAAAAKQALPPQSKKRSPLKQPKKPKLNDTQSADADISSFLHSPSADTFFDDSFNGGKHTPRLHCPKCHKLVKSEEKLETHLNKVHRKPSKQAMTCPNCGAIFVSHESFDKHIFSEKCSKAVHPCEVPGCQKRFANENHLVNHMRNKHQNLTLDDSFDW